MSGGFGTCGDAPEYDALATNDSAVKVLGDEPRARELVATVGAIVTIDRTIRENVRAQLRVLVKRMLREKIAQKF